MSEILPGDAEVAFLRSEIERLTRERDEVKAELARRNREEGAYRQSVVGALAEAGIPHSTPAEGTDATKIPHGRTMFQAGDRIRLLTRERDEAIRRIGPLAAENERLRGALEKAAGDLRIAASYADEPGISLGLRTHSRSCADTLRVVEAALAGEGEVPTCAWKQDEDGIWHTACVTAWVYEAGGTPAEHRQIYCHHCGRKVRAYEYRETP